MSLWDAATDEEQAILFQALDTLKHSAGFMSAIDVSNAEVNMANVRYRPLTEAAIRAANQLQALIPLPTEENAGRVAADVTDIFTK